MQIGKNIKWFCENAGALEKFSGRWVVFNIQSGIVKTSSSMQSVLKSSAQLSEKEKPFIFHVPSKTELDSPAMGASKKSSAS